VIYFTKTGVPPDPMGPPTVGQIQNPTKKGSGLGVENLKVRERIVPSSANG